MAILEQKSFLKIPSKCIHLQLGLGLTAVVQIVIVHLVPEPCAVVLRASRRMGTESTHVLVGLEDDDVNFGREETGERHGCTYAHGHTQRRRLKLYVVKYEEKKNEEI